LGDANTLADELLADDSIQIVIGPMTSDEVFALAPAFIKRNKLIISPTATSGNIIRAFGKKGYFWRTTQGDVAQVKAIVTILKENNAKKIALLTVNSTYGQTFYDWTGFFAAEYGISLASIEQFETGSRDLDGYVERALSTNPGYIIAACEPSDAAAIKRAIDRSGSTTKLFLTDAANTPLLLSLLGDAAEGIEGTSPTADPKTGFAVAYREKFGHAPPDYAAPTYDALLLAAYTTARQDATFLESPADSIRKVVYGNGTETGWDGQESHETIVALRDGATPAISGASGPLDFDIDFGVDPLTTWYSHWGVEDEEFRTIGTIGSAKTGSATGSDESVARSRASSRLMSTDLITTETEKFVPAQDRSDFQAVIVGPSRGWTNYRHQSDALAIYTLLREHGVDDDHIIFMSYDDVPTLPENPLKGDVHNIPKGENLRSGATADYTGKNVSAETLRNVLTGTRTEATPVVLESNAGTDVFVYIASHGTPGGIVFSRDNTLTTSDFADITNSMYRDQQYRQMVFVVDTCFGESIASSATAPGILYLTGASASEPSLGAVYDIEIKQWLSDEFTSSVVSIIRSEPDVTFRELYTSAYERVMGSHVRLVVTNNVSTLDERVGEFLRP
jgi:glycosylphosphatidylinositol transamidase (GPIT) subunit GPI8/ABC-type branched-subunit amino acid transport system substrate-binding protein